MKAGRLRSPTPARRMPSCFAKLPRKSGQKYRVKAPVARRRASSPNRSCMIRLLFVAASLLALTGTARADPDALWKIIDQKCMPDQQEHGQPAPCAKVDLQAGYVVLKDLIGDT